MPITLGFRNSTNLQGNSPGMTFASHRLIVGVSLTTMRAYSRLVDTIDTSHCRRPLVVRVDQENCEKVLGEESGPDISALVCVGASREAQQKISMNYLQRESSLRISRREVCAYTTGCFFFFFSFSKGGYRV